MKIDLKSKYGSKYQGYLNALKPDLLRLSGKDFDIKQMRKELNTFKTTLPPKLEPIVLDVIFFLKKIHNGNHASGCYIDHKGITDHAFVKGLERIYGVDVFKVKERMIKSIETSGLDYIKLNGKIITVLPVSK